MAQLIEAFTKRKITDIRESEDTIDREYSYRVIRVKSKRELVELISDYEEFLPSGFGKVRDMTEEEVEKLLDNLRRYFSEVYQKKVYSGPANVSILLLQPYLLLFPRMWAMQITAERSKKNGGYVMTWGQAWKELQAEGAIEKVCRRQEHIYSMLLKAEEEQ